MSSLVKILVVEDEAIVALDIRQRLEKMGFEVTGTAATGDAALKSVQANPPQLILMDIQIRGDYDGIETASRIRESFDIPVVFLTANSDRATIDRAKSSGPFGYLLKPFEDRELQTTIEIVLERHRLEREIKEKQRWLAVTLASIGDAIVTFDVEGRLTYLNPVAAQLTGWSNEEAIGRPAEEVLTLTLNGAKNFQPISPIADVLGSGKTKYLPEYALLTRKDGVKIAIEDSAAPIRLENGELIGAVIAFRDVTAKILTEKKLREAENRIQNVVNTVQEGIGEIDENEIIRYCNPAFAAIVGLTSPESLIGQSIRNYIDPDWIERMIAEIERRKQGETSCYELGLIKVNGEKVIAQVTATPLLDERGTYRGTVAALVDISDRKKLEAELHQHREHLQELVEARTDELLKAGAELQRQFAERERADAERQELATQLQKAQKMEALGLLAGGVAHDLNNTLGPLVGYPELMMQKLPEDSPLRRMVEKIGRAAEDAASIIQDLLTLARRGRYEMHPISVNDVVTDFVESPAFVRLPAEKPGVKLVLELDSNLPNIKGSSVHLAKVVMNLVVNAFDAIEDNGIVTIKSYSQRLDHLDSGFANIPEGEYIILRVADDGCGISMEDLAKIFEPYFSKKRMGRSGTGLGLSIVYSIVEDHSGYYDVFSELGRGTEFVLYFPMTAEARYQKSDQKACGGEEAILVVDDNEEQRELAREILESYGYRLRTARNGREAVTILRTENYDLVLLDMIMEPDFDGLDTYRKILEFKPEQRTIVVSGFSPTERVEKLLSLGASGYLKKPYSVDALAKIVRETLDSSPNHAMGLTATGRVIRKEATAK